MCLDLVMLYIQRLVNELLKVHLHVDGMRVVFFKLHAHSVYSCAVRFSSCVIVLVDFVDICFHRHFLPTISGSSFRFASQEDNTKTISVKEFEKALRTWNFPRATKQVPLGPMSKLYN